MMTGIGVCRCPAESMGAPWEVQVAPDCIIGRLSNHPVKIRVSAPRRGFMLK